MCDRVVIIDKGKIVADDTTSKLSKMAGSGIIFKVEFKEKLNEKQLLKLSFIKKVSKASDGSWLIESVDDKDIRQDIFQFAVEKKLNVLSLSQQEQNMEDIFRRLTKK